MILIRSLILFLSNLIFRLALFFSISILTFLSIYTSRTYIPTVLDSNNAYERFIPSILETNKEQSLTSRGSVTLGDSDVQRIITEAIPAEKIKQSVETINASFYKWLEGDTPTLEFSISLVENKQKLAEGLAGYAISRLEQLPECVGEGPETIDPFTATCKPANMDLEAERQYLIEELYSATSFIEDTEITASKVIDLQNEQIQNVPFYYSLARLSWIPLGLILTLSAGIVVLISSNTKRGLRKIAYGMFGTGVSLIFFTLLFSFVMPVFTGSLPILSTNGEGIDALLNDISLTMGRDYAVTTIYYCLPLVVIGGLMLLLTRRKSSDKYHQLEKRAGIANSNEKVRKKYAVKKAKPPIQSSEVSTTKPAKSKKHKKYRTIPKKEV